MNFIPVSTVFPDYLRQRQTGKGYSIISAQPVQQEGAASNWDVAKMFPRPTLVVDIQSRIR